MNDFKAKLIRASLSGKNAFFVAPDKTDKEIVSANYKNDSFKVCNMSGFKADFRAAAEAIAIAWKKDEKTKTADKQ